MADDAVVDASLIVDVLVSTPRARRSVERLAGTILHAPAHFDAEILSALGRIHRAGAISADTVRAALRRAAELPVERHPVAGLLVGAWRLRNAVRLVDALYVVLARRLGHPLITTDARLARATPVAELVGDGEA
jgi:predicted nucleic acid-binding protein